jgi:autotransporter family porin
LAGAGSISNSSTGIIAGGHGGNNSAVTTYYYNGFLHKHHFNYPGASGNGGTGLFSGAGETILNQGQIIGGTGGSGQGGQAGSGGVGLYAATGVNITNNGSITGGNGNRSYYRSLDDRPGTPAAPVCFSTAPR